MRSLSLSGFPEDVAYEEIMTTPPIDITASLASASPPEDTPEPVQEFTVPAIPTEEAMKKIDSAARVASLTLYGIIALSVVGVTAISILFWLGKPEGATAVSTMLIPTIASLAAFRKGNENQKAIHEVSVSVDGRLSQLLKTTKVAAKAEGVVEGKATQRTRREDIREDDSPGSIDTGLTHEESSLP